MTCKDLMTADPKCCVPSDTVARAAEIMRDEDVGPVPVVNDRTGKRLVGIVTDRDVAVKVVAAGRDPKATRVSDVMSGSLATCRVDDDYTEALDCMARNQVRRVPVVNEDGSLAGIISQADVARSGSEEEVGEVVEEISEPTGLGRMGRLRGLAMGGGPSRAAAGANALLMGAACLAVGAGMMYLMDPSGGRGRRARIKDKASSLYHDSAEYAGRVQRDLQDRAHNVVDTAKQKLRRSEPGGTSGTEQIDVG